MNKVISFSSGKGGVGKTTLVANLGSLWAEQGKRVLMIDADWSLGKLGLTLGVRPTATIHDVLSGKKTLCAAITPVTNRLDLLASPSGVLGSEELSEAARHQLLFEMESLANRYDLILFDHSSGVHWGVLPFAAAAHQHVIVTTSEPTSYTDAYAIMKILSKRFAIRDFCLLVTLSQSRSESETIITRFSEFVRSRLGIRLTLLDIFPWEPRVAESIRRQKPFAGMYPQSDFTTQLRRLCDQLETGHLRPNHGLSFFYANQSSVRQP
jgi:flagellar biosynthesis protein FlhG